MGSVQRTKRDSPPKHFSLRIEAFSKLAKASTDGSEMFESVTFIAEGYHWKLQLYPNGNSKSHGRGYISLYLAIDSIPHHQDVHMKVEFFIFDQKNNKYLTIQDGTEKRFHRMKKAWGYDQLLELNVFKNSAYGYLVNDCCEFGVEISAVRSTTEEQQTIKINQPTTLQPFTSTFTNFSTLGKDLQYGVPMTFDGKTWMLQMYPKGYGTEQGNSLSLLLELVDVALLPSGEQVWAEYKLRVVNRNQNKHKEITKQHWFSNSDTRPWGEPKFMPLGDLLQPSKGFLDNDTLIVEVEFLNISSSSITFG